MEKNELKSTKEVQIHCFLNCDYQDSRKVKKLGAKWHQEWGMWYVEIGTEITPFKKWLFEEGK